jgi:ABC-type sugar transport system ATPase subunit
MVDHNDDTLLVVEDLRKNYGGLLALDGVRLEVRRGEVHAVVGENGAGKSTLMKILGGATHRDSGTITFAGRKVEFRNPRDSIGSGIAVIHQELSVLPKMNIIENIFMGRMPSVMGKVLWRRLEEGTSELLAQIGLDADPYIPMADLSISQRQLVEIAKALSIDASLIIMDEPNSSLSEYETDRLFGVIRSLKSRNVSVIYVSHKIEEVLRISDRVTAFRDGGYVGTVDSARATVDDIIKMMIGRELTREYVPNETAGPVLLEVKGLTGSGFRDVSFDLRRGEVLCFAGLVGAGRSETMRAIFGAEPAESGEIAFEGRRVRFGSPKEALANGFAMVQEDRKKLSLFMNLDILMNIGIAQMPRIKRGLVLDRAGQRDLARRFFRSLAIKARSAEQPVRDLSGGNQQKVVLARWLATNPKVLILDEPTHGIDIGAKSEIYELIRRLAREGVAIILISSELPEVIAMADRAVVMHEGRVAAVLERGRIDEHTIMSYATGNIGGNAQ